MEKKYTENTDRVGWIVLEDVSAVKLSSAQAPKLHLLKSCSCYQPKLLNLSTKTCGFLLTKVGNRVSSVTQLSVCVIQRQFISQAEPVWSNPAQHLKKKHSYSPTI